MTQRQINKLVKIKKILNVKQDEALTGEIKDYMINDTMPRHEKNLPICNEFKNFLEKQKQFGIFPTMPSDDWIAEHGSIAPPYDEPNNDKGE